MSVLSMSTPSDHDHAANDDGQTGKDRTYSPSSEAETAAKQDDWQSVVRDPDSAH